jgi:hypothetical protein
MRGLVRILVLAGFAYAWWELLKRAQAADESRWETQPAQPDRSEPKTSAPSSSPAPAQPAPASGSGNGATKAELYERATELGIKGRSKMSKAELERAIREVG